jgi:hypothetical protein
MITFAKFYKTKLVSESTRRDFLKQITGAVAAIIGAPVNAASSHTPQDEYSSHVVYDLTPTVSIKSLASFLTKYKQAGNDAMSRAAEPQSCILNLILASSTAPPSNNSLLMEVNG